MTQNILRYTPLLKYADYIHGTQLRWDEKIANCAMLVNVAFNQIRNGVDHQSLLHYSGI